MLRMITYVLLLVLLLTFFLVGCSGNENTLEYKIIKHYNENKNENENLYIAVSDFTDFEWDRFIVFTPSVTTKEVSEALGVNYNRYLDISAGIVFINGDEIVYEEIFKTNENFNNKPSPFIIYPHSKNATERPKYKVFTKEEAEFECIQTYHGNNYYYHMLFHVLKENER